MDIIQKITKIIEPTLTDMGFCLVRILYQGAETNNTLQIMVERSDYSAMHSDDCEKISRALSAILDVEDIIANRYTLEVTSPGIDRPLVKLADYERFAGREAKIETLVAVENRKRFKGKILKVEENQVVIDFEGQELKIDFEIISKAKLVLTDELLAQMLKGNK
ncbi:MAG: ribosome maturation factor RimP [Alphaproteobacteria bacterium]|nr:ribosome maturation factor RimP [Alphaproteobacteria bacterium]